MVKTIHGDHIGFQCEICLRIFKERGYAELCESLHKENKAPRQDLEKHLLK